MGVSSSSVALAKLEVMKAVQNISKDGHNDNHHYKYASEEHIVSVMRTAMIANGLAMYPSSASDVQVFPRQKGGFIFVWIQTYTLVHAPSAQAERIQVVTSGFDTLDKAAFKGMTGALKYALRQAFLVPIGGVDAEGDKHSTEPKPAGFVDRADEARFFDYLSGLPSAMSADDLGEFLTWMRETQGKSDWPATITDTQVAWREWFCRFLDDAEKVDDHGGTVWLGQWLQS